MKFLIFLIVYLVQIQISLAGDTLNLSIEDSLTLSAKLLDEKKYDQSLSKSLPIYEQRKEGYVLAGVLAMRSYLSTHNSKDAVIVGDEIKEAVQRDLVEGNISLCTGGEEMADYFYWSFVTSYAAALHSTKRYSDDIPYFRKLISHGEKVGIDTYIFIMSLADSCMEVSDFKCAENNYNELLNVAKKNTKYSEHEKKIYYNLACAVSGLGEYKQAKNYLLSTGWKWSELEKLVTEDSDLKGFRDSEYFEQLRSKIQNN